MSEKDIKNKNTEEELKVEENDNKNVELKNEIIAKKEVPETPKEEFKVTEEKTYNNYEANLKNKSKKGVIAFAVIAILILILALFSTIFALANLNNARILDGVTVKGISLKGLTKEEAKAKLTEEFTKQLQSNVNLTYKEFSSLINGEQIGASYDIDALVDEAHSIGRSGNILEE